MQNRQSSLLPITRMSQSSTVLVTLHVLLLSVIMSEQKLSSKLHCINMVFQCIMSNFSGTNPVQHHRIFSTKQPQTYSITSRAATKPHTRRFSFLNSGLMQDTVCMCVALASFPLIERFLSSARLFKSSPHAFSTNCTSNERAAVNYQLSITTVPGSCFLVITQKNTRVLNYIEEVT